MKRELRIQEFLSVQPILRGAIEFEYGFRDHDVDNQFGTFEQDGFVVAAESLTQSE